MRGYATYSEVLSSPGYVPKPVTQPVTQPVTVTIPKAATPQAQSLKSLTESYRLAVGSNSQVATPVGKALFSRIGKAGSTPGKTLNIVIEHVDK